MCSYVQNFAGTLLLEELLTDIGMQLDELIRECKNPFACAFSPSKMETTVAQTYFLFVGRLTHSLKGFRVLERGDILRRFLDIIQSPTHHISHVKLILSSLSYKEEFCR